MPSIDSTAPTGATAGSGNFVLAVAGTGFVPGSVVQWNGSERTTRFVSATQLVAYIPGSDVASTGSAQLTVVNPTPGGGASPAVAFGITP